MSESRSFHRASTASQDSNFELFRALEEETDPIARGLIFDQIVIHNRGLVMRVASRFERRGERVGLTRLDLIQEGQIGLMRAVEKFEPSREAAFSTYANFWIFRHITRAIADYSVTSGTRMPIGIHERIAKVLRVIEQLQKSLGRKPTTEEIHAALGEIKTKNRKSQFSLPQVETVLSLLERSKRSLDAGWDEPEPEHRSAHEVIAQTVFPIADSRIEAIQMLHEIQQQVERIESVATETLSERSLMVVTCRLGLFGAEILTLREIGEFLGGLSRERVRQIERDGFKRLSNALNLKIDEVRATLRAQKALLEFISETYC